MDIKPTRAWFKKEVQRNLSEGRDRYPYGKLGRPRDPQIALPDRYVRPVDGKANALPADKLPVDLRPPPTVLEGP